MLYAKRQVKRGNVSCLLVSFCCGVILSCPEISFAAVTINEIAWMGNSNSANDEWIELYNNGEVINLDGWLLTDNNNLNISLSGSLGGNSYAVLERTDDSSASGSAYLVYSGALTNVGAILTLKRADGSIEDQVAGGEDWENVGGNNSTKETAQYTSSGWITAAATPGKVNAAEDSGSNEEQESGEVITVSNSSSNSSVSDSKDTLIRGILDEDFELKIKAPSVVYVNQTFNLDAMPDGVSDRLFKRLNYSWSLGDGEAGYQRYLTHSYQFPGNYVVVLTSKYNRIEQVARKNITVLPVNFSITRNSEGDVQINNDAKYEINLSGYTVSGQKNIVLPENTILLAGATITISKENLSATYDSLVRLFDSESVLVASTNMSNSVQSTEDDFSAAAAAPLVTNEQFSFVTESVDDEEKREDTVSEQEQRPKIINRAEADEIGETQTDSETGESPMIYILLAVVMALGVGGLVLSNKTD